MDKNKFHSNVRFYNSQRIKIAYLSVSVRAPPSLVPLATKPQPSVYIFSIDKETGGIYHGGFPNIDIFPNETSFSNFLKNIYPEIFDQEDLGSHLIGATVSNNQLVIACVKEKEEVAKIFKQPIYKITNVNFKNIPLWNNVQPTSPILHNFNISYNHFFCPTLDISAKFPYPKYIISNGAFCWNKRFLVPFEENRALHACIIVLQGAAFSMSKEYKTGYNIFYIIKRSAMFPGTRYNARGLNSPVDPANECECDLIFLANNKYYAQSWRRGSPPVLWETEIKNLVMANHVVKENANSDTPMYFLDSIIQRFESEKVCVISLLQKHGQEKKIDNAYSEGVENLSRVFPHVTMKYIGFDLNALLKEKGIKGMVDDFYLAINEDINGSNFTVVDSKTGEYHMTKEDNQPKIQKTVFRFNCADSLDRTNVATFFYSLVLTAKFINKSGYDQFKKQNVNGIIDLKHPIDSLNHKVIDFLGDCFIESGNIISLMYTNTDAIKTHLIRYFMTPTKEGNKDSDKVVSVYRRFQNCVLDSSRQAIIEEWTCSNVKNAQFTLDEQHISLVSRTVYESTLITHQILESPIRKISFMPKGDNAIIVMFPEPFLLCSFSIFVVPNLINSLFNMTLTIDGSSTSHSLFFHNITLPQFSEYQKVSKVEEADDNVDKEVKGVWVTYDIRKIAKRSNYFPIEPLCLQPTSFVSIRYTAFCKQINLSNVTFRVKRPNNPRKCYYITGTPPEIKGKSFEQNVAEIYKNLNYREQTLSELRSIELSRIENGINNYFRNNYIVKLKRNPWIYDMQSYILKKSKDMYCVNCGEKANDYDKNPPFFIPDSQFPITYVKTDKLDPSNKKDAIVLCKDCKPIFDDQMQIQLYVLKNVTDRSLVNVNEYVGFLPTTFSRYESSSFELCYLAKVFVSTFGNIDQKQYQKLLNGGDAGIEIFKSGTAQRVVLTFPVSVCLDKLKVTFQKPVPHDSFDIGLTIYDDKELKKATLTMEEAEKDKEEEEPQNGSSSSNQNENANCKNNKNVAEPSSNEGSNPIRSEFQFRISNAVASITSLQITFEKKDSCLINEIRSKEAAKSAASSNRTDSSSEEDEEDDNDDDDDDDDDEYEKEKPKPSSSVLPEATDFVHILSCISITGTFKYVSARETFIESCPVFRLPQSHEPDEKSKKKKESKKNSLNDFPRFSETKCSEWSSTFRSQKFKYNKKTIRGYAIKQPQSKDNRAYSLILVFFSNDKYISHEPVIIPSFVDNDEIMYFPAASRPTDFNLIYVYYLDRIGSVEPYKFMFFD